MAQRAKTAELYLKGKAVWEIAQLLGVSSSTVSNDLKRIHEEWRQQSIMDLNRLKVQQLAKLDRIELEAWEAWAKSRTDAEAEEVTTEQYLSRTGAPRTSTSTKKSKAGQSGESRFLVVIQNCIKQRCDILGLNAPLEVDLKSYQAVQDSARDKLLGRLSSIANAATQKPSVQ